MKKSLVTILLVCIIFHACAQPKNTYPGWDYMIDEYKKGVEGIKKYSGTGSETVRNQLFIFLTDNKDLYFESEQEYNRVDGLFKMISGELIEGLTLWREYAVQTGDYVTPRLEMYYILGSGYERFTSFLKYDVDQYMISHDIILPEYQSSLIIAGDPDSSWVSGGQYPAPYYDKLTFKEEKTRWREIYDFAMTQIESKKSLFLQGFIRDSYLMNDPEYYKWIIAQKNNSPTSEMGVDNLIFLHEFNKGNFQTAYEIGKKYNFELDFNPDMEKPREKYTGNSWNIPYIYYASGHLEEFIDAYESMSDYVKERETCYGAAPKEFWLAAAYGQRKEFDKGLEYLDKVLAEVNMWEGLYPVKGKFEENTLVAVLWFCYMSDAFDSYREAGRFDEVEWKLKRRLADFSHLDWIPDKIKDQIEHNPVKL